MSIEYPTNLDALSNPSSGDALNSPSHADQHSNANDAIEALEAKVGVNSSAVTTSHDYKLGEVTGSDKAVGKTSTQTLTNKTLTNPIINLSSNATGDMYYRKSDGTLERLLIGATNNIIQVSAGGVPEWVANPSGSAKVNVQTFTSSGTWTKPTGAKSVSVVVIGGGGSGASGDCRAYTTNSIAAGGGGGGGGSITTDTFPASLLTGTVAVTVGAEVNGGAGVASSGTGNVNGNNGTDGNLSSFGSYLIANGGKLGQRGTSGGGNGGFVTGFGTSIASTSATAILGQGATGGSSVSGKSSEYGGGSGASGFATANDANPYVGGSSVFGCGGGGGGGSAETNDAPTTSTAGSAGGTSGSYIVGGGGIAGVTNGGDGGNGTRILLCSSGGGGGGGRYQATTGQVGGKGGDGGTPGGAGGGGGACGGVTGASLTSGAGGKGARGEVIVTTYLE